MAWEIEDFEVSFREETTHIQIGIGQAEEPGWIEVSLSSESRPLAELVASTWPERGE